MVENKKEVKIKTEPEEIHKIENFIEEICDQYNIFNSYFGNILTAVVEGCEIIIEHIEKAQLDKRYITVSFHSKKDCLAFNIQSPVEIFKKEFLEEDFSDNEYDHRKKYLIIKYLSDDLEIFDNGKQCTVNFYISSINYDKTVERNTLLNEYFDKINLPKKV